MTTCNLEVYKPFTETEYLDLRQAVDEISLAAIDEHIVGRLFATIDAAQAKAEHYSTCRMEGIVAERDEAVAEVARLREELAKALDAETARAWDATAGDGLTPDDENYAEKIQYGAIDVPAEAFAPENVKRSTMVSEALLEVLEAWRGITEEQRDEYFRKPGYTNFAPIAILLLKAAAK